MIKNLLIAAALVLIAGAAHAQTVCVILSPDTTIVQGVVPCSATYNPPSVTIPTSDVRYVAFLAQAQMQTLARQVGRAYAAQLALGVTISGCTASPVLNGTWGVADGDLYSGPRNITATSLYLNQNGKYRGGGATLSIYDMSNTAHVFAANQHTAVQLLFNTLLDYRSSVDAVYFQNLNGGNVAWPTPSVTPAC